MVWDRLASVRVLGFQISSKLQNSLDHRNKFIKQVDASTVLWACRDERLFLPSGDLQSVKRKKKRQGSLRLKVCDDSCVSTLWGCTRGATSPGWIGRGGQTGAKS